MIKYQLKEKHYLAPLILKCEKYELKLIVLFMPLSAILNLID